MCSTVLASHTHCHSTLWHSCTDVGSGSFSRCPRRWGSLHCPENILQAESAEITELPSGSDARKDCDSDRGELRHREGDGSGASEAAGPCNHGLSGQAEGWGGGPGHQESSRSESGRDRDQTLGPRVASVRAQLLRGSYQGLFTYISFTFSPWNCVAWTAPWSMY